GRGVPQNVAKPVQIGTGLVLSHSVLKENPDSYVKYLKLSSDLLINKKTGLPQLSLDKMLGFIRFHAKNLQKPHKPPLSFGLIA
ncbi:hypothetical protein, partial [Klebsiella pneumoniae]|uniref:hypothetical protein n=1 Tax=Klebsiella pneumoniae TaxID=573 RepID=UPI003B59515D